MIARFAFFQFKLKKSFIFCIRKISIKFEVKKLLIGDIKHLKIKELKKFGKDNEGIKFENEMILVPMGKNLSNFLKTQKSQTVGNIKI